MPSYTMLYHPLQRVYLFCTTGILLLKITTFCPNMTENSTAADHKVGGCFLICSLFAGFLGFFEFVYRICFVAFIAPKSGSYKFYIPDHKSVPAGKVIILRFFRYRINDGFSFCFSKSFIAARAIVCFETEDGTRPLSFYTMYFHAYSPFMTNHMLCILFR